MKLSSVDDKDDVGSKVLDKEVKTLLPFALPAKIRWISSFHSFATAFCVRVNAALSNNYSAGLT